MNAMNTPLRVDTLPASLLAQIGESVAGTVAQVLQRWPDAPPEAAALLDQLEQLGLQAQEVVRMLIAPAGAMPEQVNLGVAALQARAEWTAALHRAGATWRGPQGGCEVLTNPAVLKQLLDLAIAHALQLGTALQVEVDQRFQPPLAALRIEVSRPGGELFAAQPGDVGELHWALLTALARHAGVHVERQVRALSVELLLGWAPLGALAPVGLPEPAMLPHTEMPTGCRVLLLEPHEPTRVQAERLLLKAGLQVKAVASVDQAQATLMHGAPDSLVTGIEASDPACTLLLQELRARQPGLRVVEVVRQAHSFAISLPGSGVPARVGRDDLARTLVPALAQELTMPT
jgi:CheY-like chemotaxis protein